MKPRIDHIVADTIVSVHESIRKAVRTKPTRDERFAVLKRRREANEKIRAAEEARKRIGLERARQAKERAAHEASQADERARVEAARLAPHLDHAADLLTAATPTEAP